MGAASAVLVVAVASAGCGSGPPERPEVLGELADSAIVPAYDSAAREAAGLRAAVDDLCNDDAPAAEELSAAQEALAAARAAWLRTEAVWVGPVMQNRSWALVDWPVDPEGVEAGIADPELSTDPADLATRVGADTRGLRTVEYLLGPEDARATTLQALAGARRCSYLLGVTEVLAGEVESVDDAWRGRGEPAGYPAAFVENPDALDEVVNDLIDIIRQIVDAELGAALGTGESEADPAAVVDGPLQLGVSDLSDRLEGISAVLVGDDDQPGLSSLLGDDLSRRIRQQFDDAREAISSVRVPLSEAVVEDPEAVAEARDAIDDLRVTLGAEVVSRLGVTVGFSDADGDSAG